MQNSANHGIYLRKKTPPEGAWTRGIARRTNIAKACANVETSVQGPLPGCQPLDSTAVRIYSILAGTTPVHFWEEPWIVTTRTICI
ncbi:hypothetical protein DESPIGER_0102 [Desulfovibrio piger]|uniref:Uncharacterized protein n=1 Tax=Desulfovibrio piger TaxID=901 RepID=A0A1K1LBB6_9BACT|nr:hypothetical protein DESPIGER_0102 [Desulfovibrio piger]